MTFAVQLEVGSLVHVLLVDDAKLAGYLIRFVNVQYVGRLAISVSSFALWHTHKRCWLLGLLSCTGIIARRID